MTLYTYLLLFVVLFFSGCVSSTPKNKSTKLIQGPDEIHLATLLRTEADKWSGTPHILGGTSRNGIDCSALVQTVYKDVLDVSLPRTTALQSKVGKLAHLNGVKVGDLVFYHIDAGTRHVGIYVGEGEFMHASKSNGVTISSLNDVYWQKRFWMIRRILDTGQTEVTEDESAADQNGSRVRW